MERIEELRRSGQSVAGPGVPAGGHCHDGVQRVAPPCPQKAPSDVLIKIKSLFPIPNFRKGNRLFYNVAKPGSKNPEQQAERKEGENQGRDPFAPTGQPVAGKTPAQHRGRYKQM